MVEQFVEKARKVHGDKYDYSNVVYINSKINVAIKCLQCGKMFYQSPNSHLRGRGCPDCALVSRTQKHTLTLAEFKSRAENIHGIGRYDYSNVMYKGHRFPVEIKCNRCGAVFHQKANSHLTGRGCPKCAEIDRHKNSVLTTEDFIRKANTVHGNKYDYSNVHYRSSSIAVTIGCPIHGEFLQNPNNHLRGATCPSCAREARRTAMSLTTEMFIAKAKNIHNDYYSYKMADYKGFDTKITITCPEHGDFLQTPDDHLQGKGCPKCGHKISKSETEIYNFCVSLLGDDLVETRNRIILKGKELDIYIPSKKIAIEYDGLRWHSEKFLGDKNYHLEKTLACNAAGIRLIHIFEDEWLNHKDIVKDKLAYLLGCQTQSPVIGARKCEVRVISKAEAQPFLDANHIQGYAPASVYLGAYYVDRLVSVMTFVGKSRKWELNRFATDNTLRVPGVASKLFKYFCTRYEYDEVKSFLDLRWNQPGNTVYEKLGFKVEKVLPPDYAYVIGETRVHKFLCRKQILSKKYNLPLSLTEKEMCDRLSFYRIWNCGLVKYVLTGRQ